MANITVTNDPNPRFDGDWQVMYGAFCQSRHATEAEAREAAVGVEAEDRVMTHATNLLERVEENLTRVFSLTPDQAKGYIREALDLM